MTAYIISNPKQFFTDSSGAPLDAGYVYIGISGQNPETAPASVYWDDAMTIPAAQPIRTISGYPSRNGAAASIYTAESQFSVTVKDKSGRIVVSDRTYKPFGFSSTDLADMINKGLVGGVVDIRDYGADPDADDNSDAISLAIDALTDNSMLYIPDGEFLLDDTGGQERPSGTGVPTGTCPTKFTISGLNNITIGGPGKLRLARNGVCNWHFFEINGCTNVKILGGSYEGNREPDISMINYNGEVGEVFRVYNTTGFIASGVHFTKVSITCIRIGAGTTHFAIGGCIAPNNNDAFVQVGDDSVSSVDDIPGIGCIDGNVITDFYTDAGIKLRYSYRDVVISNNTVRAYDGVETQNPGALMIRGKTNYDDYCTNVTVTGNKLYSVAAYTLSMNETLSGVGRHPQNIKIVDNDIVGNVITKCRDLKFDDNRVSGIVEHALAGDAVITNNEMDYNDAGTARVISAPVSGAYSLKIKDNKLKTDTTGHVIFAENVAYCDISDNEIHKTGSSTSSSNAVEVYVPADGICEIERNKIYNDTSYRLANGIRVSGAGSGSVTTIKGNKVVRAGSYSVRLGSGCTGGVIDISGNYSASPTTGDFINSAAGSTVVLGAGNSFPAPLGGDVGDASVTVTSGSSPDIILYNTPITAARTVTLSTTGATKYDKHRILRTAACTGAYNVNVGTGPLKALAAAGTWCDVMYDGSAWVLIGYGTL